MQRRATREGAGPESPAWSSKRGSNQISVRSHNERLILHLIRRRGDVTQAELSRETGLSPNAVSVIIRALEEVGLVAKATPIRGRVGQPTTPVRLNAEGRFYFGLKVGRRSADLVLVDLVGAVRGRQSIRYRYPEPANVREFVAHAIRHLLKSTRLSRARVSGFGLAMPFEIWGWTDEIGVPSAALDVWKDVAPGDLLPRNAPWEVVVVNDATAACVAEISFAASPDIRDAIYLFVGTLIGGAVVLNGDVFFGRTGRAGGFGPFRVPGGAAGADRLIDHASLTVLDRMLREAGHDPSAIHADPERWALPPEILDRWLDGSARAIAHAIASSLSVIEFEAVILDGSFPPEVRDALVDRVHSAFLRMDLQGLNVPGFTAGHYGDVGRAVGAAAMPMNKAYSINRNNMTYGLPA